MGMLRTKSGQIGIALLTFHLLLAAFSPLLVPYDPNEMAHSSVGTRPEAPSRENPFGRDHLARDVLSRTTVGGRVALAVTIGAVALTVVWGTIVGMFIGLVGGLFDDIAMRLLDTVQSLPGFVMLLLIISFGTEIVTFILILLCSNIL
ncbi:hypothetical protein KFU94_41130 [Chloroflexi bacterium TSY]|nr:hypothetical protein [Chloroflexi bacterium TSY]